jgi:hypothetical protein
MMHSTPPDASLCSRLPSLLPSIDSVSFWLVVVCVVLDWWPSKADVLLIFVLFCHSNCCQNRFYNASPPHSTPAVPPLKHPSYHEHQLLVGCCVFLLSFSHLRPRHHFLSTFQRVLFCPLQTSQPTVAPPNQTTGA